MQLYLDQILFGTAFKLTKIVVAENYNLQNSRNLFSIGEKYVYAIADKYSWQA